MYLKLSRIWYLTCFVFCALNIHILYKEKDSINYIVVEKDDALYDNKTNYLLCNHFDNILRRGNLKIQNLKLTNVSVPVFIHFSKLIYEDYLNVTNLFQPNESYIFNDCVCFKASKDDLESDLPVKGYLASFTLSVFIYSDGKIPYFHEIAHDKTHRLDSIYLRVLKQKVYGENYLRNAKCSNFNEQLSFNRFHCINKCLKAQGTKTGLLDTKDFVEFDLNRIFRNNQTLNEVDYPEEEWENNGISLLKLNSHEEKKYEPCFKQCPTTDDCFYETSNVAAIDHLYYKYHLKDKGKDKIDLKTNIFKAYYSLQDFYPQLFGLLSLFTGTSILSVLQKLFDKLIKLAENARHLKFVLTKLKITLIIIVILINIYISYLFFADYNLKLKYPNRTLSLTYSAEPFSLVFCFPLEILIYNDGEIKEGRNSEILNNFTFSELESRTNDVFERQFDSFRFFFANHNSQFNKVISKKVLFKNGTADKRPCLQRCFRLEVKSKESEYKRLLPFSVYNITMNHKYWQMFIVDTEQNFTSNLFDFKSQFYIRKITEISSRNSRKSKCKNYLKKYSSCDSKQSCLDRCINLKFFKKYKTLPMNSLIDKNVITGFGKLDLRTVKFNDTRDLRIEAECIKKFKRKDCVDSHFEESLEMVSNHKIGETIIINANYESLLEEELDESLIKLLFDIINLKSIFFGLNASGILHSLFPVLKVAFNFQKFNSYQFPILFVCWIGFSIHCFLIFKTLADGNFIQSGYFSKIDNYTLPNVIFCFTLQKYKYDHNRRLDSNYLDELTYLLTYERIFYQIIYNNKTHSKAINFNVFNMTNDYHSDSEIELSYFYLSNSKCFEINLKLSYDSENGYTQNEKRILKIVLRNRFSILNRRTFFFYREKTTNQLGRGHHFEIGNVSRVNNTNYFHSYESELELYQKKSEDVFEKFKHPRDYFLSFFRTSEANLLYDTTKYLLYMKSKFKEKYNLTSQHVMLDRQNFDLEINERLLDQYYMQVQNLSDSKLPTSINYEQRSYNVYTRISYPREDFKYFDFAFSHSLISRNLDIKNEENAEKLVINILNTLSLWLNFCVLFLHSYLMLTTKAFLKFYQLLTRSKISIRQNLND